jgi:aminoglycoside phosphotransferase (APT) family kinase protein
LEQFSGGASNLTYQLSFDNQVFIVRCPPRGTKAKGAHDMQREYNIQLALQPSYACVPRMIACCTDPNVLGHDFYVMEKVTGMIPRANLPKGLNLSIEDTRKLCINVLDKMIELHKIDVTDTPLQQFGKGDGYAQRQIEGWIGRYEKAKTWNVPQASSIKVWLRANIPTKSRNSLIHNDFRFDNVVLDANDPLKILAILDWEMATIGDPLMDLGNALAYWVQADDDFVMQKFRRQPTNMKGMLTRKEVIAYYCEAMGFEVSDFKFYEIYGLFRLAVIVQQIYYRYHKGQTQNPAFRYLYLLANYLIWRCRKYIRT